MGTLPAKSDAVQLPSAELWEMIVMRSAEQVGGPQPPAKPVATFAGDGSPRGQVKPADRKVQVEQQKINREIYKKVFKSGSTTQPASVARR